MDMDDIIIFNVKYTQHTKCSTKNSHSVSAAPFLFLFLSLFFVFVTSFKWNWNCCEIKFNIHWYVYRLKSSSWRWIEYVFQCKAHVERKTEKMLLQCILNEWTPVLMHKKGKCNNKQRVCMFWTNSTKLSYPSMRTRLTQWNEHSAHRRRRNILEDVDDAVSIYHAYRHVDISKHFRVVNGRVGAMQLSNIFLHFSWTKTQHWLPIKTYDRIRSEPLTFYIILSKSLLWYIIYRPYFFSSTKKKKMLK